MLVCSNVNQHPKIVSQTRGTMCEPLFSNRVLTFEKVRLESRFITQMLSKISVRNLESHSASSCDHRFYENDSETVGLIGTMCAPLFSNIVWSFRKKGLDSCFITQMLSKLSVGHREMRSKSICTTRQFQFGSFGVLVWRKRSSIIVPVRMHRQRAAWNTKNLF